MNSIEGNIAEIKTQGSLSLVKVLANNILFNAIIIDTPETASYLSIDQKVSIVFKETEVIIGTDEHAKVSLQNRIVGKVQSLDCNELLTKVTLQTTIGRITSIITTNAAQNLKLKVGDTACAFIKTNEIMLAL